MKYSIDWFQNASRKWKASYKVHETGTSDCRTRKRTKCSSGLELSSWISPRVWYHRNIWGTRISCISWYDSSMSSRLGRYFIGREKDELYVFREHEYWTSESEYSTLKYESMTQIFRRMKRVIRAIDGENVIDWQKDTRRCICRCSSSENRLTSSVIG